MIPLELPPGASRVGLWGEKFGPLGINRAAAAPEGGAADWAAHPLKCGIAAHWPRAAISDPAGRARSPGPNNDPRAPFPVNSEPGAPRRPGPYTPALPQMFAPPSKRRGGPRRKAGSGAPGRGVVGTLAISPSPAAGPSRESPRRAPARGPGARVPPATRVHSRIPRVLLAASQARPLSRAASPALSGRVPRPAAPLLAPLARCTLDQPTLASVAPRPHLSGRVGGERG